MVFGMFRHREHSTIVTYLMLLDTFEARRMNDAHDRRKADSAEG